ncbi:two-component system, chemotaxis family, response regulator CheB [Halorubrum vacuolatum]|uniref:Protein-glutamate methylesterase/protein-glutamine glutaminase n=2 Tax=Halorubrum vacuolatum TaxID=63740 RepID=A0A238VUM1_HALVU|nr:two-component system, chemotaxis family, response regulator CheB [Halorubrum vacuolatum]
MLVLRADPDMSRTTDRRVDPEGSPRAVVVDDSPFMRGLIADLLTDGGVSVVGEAGDGAEAVRVVARERPDVVTMDVEMPGMNGIEAVERIMAETPTPVLMLSAYTDEGASVTFEALERGAIDFFAKPGGEISTGVSQQADRLVKAVRSVADADLDAVVRDGTESMAGTVDTADTTNTATPRATRNAEEPLTVVIGASTGGPNAVERVMSALPAMDCRVLIVQHMPEAFTARFAARLDAASAYDVSEATDGARVGSGEAVVARGGTHMEVTGYRAGRLRIGLEADDSLPVAPAVDVTMRSAAETIDDPLVGVILTGMGSDGAAGIRAMADAGARTLAQSEETCVIYGMPKRAVETGAVDEVRDLDGVAEAIVGGGA